MLHNVIIITIFSLLSASFCLAEILRVDKSTDTRGLVSVEKKGNVKRAQQSVVTEVSGSACMGDDKSRKETEQLALKEAKRIAAEYAATYIKSATTVRDSALESDLITAYASAKVSVVRELERQWYKDAAAGDCFRVRLTAEVTPEMKESASAATSAYDNPAGPLNVTIWTDTQEYRKGQQVKIYLRGNKPFYANIVYKDASGKLVQLLPNPFREDNYFSGGAIYELPSRGDRFNLAVTPPFGAESITVYAATSPPGKLNTVARGAVFEIKAAAAGVAAQARGIEVNPGSAGKPTVAEFAEASAQLVTRGDFR